MHNCRDRDQSKLCWGRQQLFLPLVGGHWQLTTEVAGAQQRGHSCNQAQNDGLQQLIPREALLAVTALRLVRQKGSVAFLVAAAYAPAAPRASFNYAP